MKKLVWDTMQVVDIYDKTYLRLDASCWYIWSRLFETQCKLLIYMETLISDLIKIIDIDDQEKQCKLLIYMMKPIWDSMQVVDIY